MRKSFIIFSSFFMLVKVNALACSMHSSLEAVPSIVMNKLDETLQTTNPPVVCNGSLDIQNICLKNKWSPCSENCKALLKDESPIKEIIEASATACKRKNLKKNSEIYILSKDKKQTLEQLIASSGQDLVAQSYKVAYESCPGIFEKIQSMDKDVYFNITPSTKMDAMAIADMDKFKLDAKVQLDFFTNDLSKRIDALTDLPEKKRAELKNSSEFKQVLSGKCPTAEANYLSVWPKSIQDVVLKNYCNTNTSFGKKFKALSDPNYFLLNKEEYKAYLSQPIRGEPEAATPGGLNNLADLMGEYSTNVRIENPNKGFHIIGMSEQKLISATPVDQNVDQIQSSDSDIFGNAFRIMHELYGHILLKDLPNCLQHEIFWSGAGEFNNNKDIQQSLHGDVVAHFKFKKIQMNYKQLLNDIKTKNIDLASPNHTQEQEALKKLILEIYKLQDFEFPNNELKIFDDVSVENSFFIDNFQLESDCGGNLSGCFVSRKAQEPVITMKKLETLLQKLNANDLSRLK
jgi:hypothetical protein